MKDSQTRGAKPAVARVVAPTFGLDDPTVLQLQHQGKFDVRIVRAPRLGREPYPPEPPGTERAADPSRWFACPSAPPMDTAVSLKALCERALRNEGIRVVHADSAWTAPMACRIRRAYELPLIVSFSGADVGLCLQSATSAARFRGLFQEAFAVTARSELIMECLIEAECPPKKIVQLRSGVDLDRYRYTPREPVRGRNVRFLFVGELTETSGIDVAIKAFAETRRVERCTELHVIGHGPQRTLADDLVRTLGVGGAVTLHGVQSSSAIREAMYASDLFVMPLQRAADGHFESCPTNLVRAQATGLPTVASRHGEVAEFVTHGRTGLLSKERDVAGLAGNMLWLVKHPEVWADMGWAGHAHMFENHDVRRCSRRLESIYSAALSAAAYGKTPGSSTYQ